MQDIKDDGLYVIPQKTRNTTKKKQVFTMTPPLAEAIQKAKELPRPVRGMLLLCTRRGGAYSRQSFYEQWLNACATAGVDDAHFHDIRAKSATDAKHQGLDHHAWTLITPHVGPLRQGARI